MSNDETIIVIGKCYLFKSVVASFEVAQDISVLEDAGFVSVCVTLNGPEEGLAIDVTLNADSVDGSAVAGKFLGKHVIIMVEN